MNNSLHKYQNITYRLNHNFNLQTYVQSMECTPQVSLYERKITLLSQQVQTHQYNEPPADTFITDMRSSATRQRSVTALKRPISLVDCFHHCGYYAVLYTNKKIVLYMLVTMKTWVQFHHKFRSQCLQVLRLLVAS
jgi:hypothetical protein